MVDGTAPNSASNRFTLFGRQVDLGIIVCFLIPALMYAPTVLYDFVFDDIVHISDNEHIRNLSGSWELFTTATYPGNLFRPVLLASYASIYALFGLDPMPQHLLNILLHALNSVLLYGGLRRLYSREIAILGALLWGTHPVLSECVANISGRAELLAFFFGMCGMAFGFGYDRKRSPLVICIYASVCEILAVLSKESAVVFPLLFFVVTQMHRSPAEHRDTPRHTLIGLGLGVIIALSIRYVALGHLFPQATVIGFLDNPLAHVPAPLRILSALVMLGRYIGICLLPFPLSADYSFPHLTPLTILPSATSCAYGILLLLLLCILLRADMRKNRQTMGGCIWFLGAFTLTANILFPIGTIFGERLLYVPLVGLIAASISVGEELFGPSLTKFACSSIVVILSGVTMAHIPVWESQGTLWSYQILVTPDSAKTQQNYATVALNQGLPTEALQHASLAIDIYPPYEHAYVIKSYALAQLGHMKGAENAARRSIQLNEYFEDGYDALARLLFHQGRYDEARRIIKQGLDINPRNPRLLEDQHVLDHPTLHQS